MQKGWYLNNIDLFDGIAPEQIMGLCEAVKDETFDGKYLLYMPKDFLDRIFLVKKGEVQLYHLYDGKKSVFDTMGPGDVFGNFSTQPILSSHFAEATPGTRICTFPVNEFLKLVSAHPEVMLRALRILSERLKDYESKISMCPQPAKDKVIQELERYQDKRRNSLFEKLTRSGMKLTHQELANMTGLNRVTVTRALQELSSEGKIAYNEHTGAIIIDDIATTADSHKA